MTDRQLIRFATRFRRGILNGACADRMCFAVCAPLVTMLASAGVETELVQVDFPFIDHVFLRLADGRVLDPTADQFNDLGATFPPVYLGPMPAQFEAWIAEEARLDALLGKVTETSQSAGPHAE